MGYKYKLCSRTYHGKTQVSGAVYIWDNDKGRTAWVRLHGYQSNWTTHFVWSNTKHHSPRRNTG